jgi:hypothetical protein
MIMVHHNPPLQPQALLTLLCFQPEALHTKLLRPQPKLPFEPWLELRRCGGQGLVIEVGFRDQRVGAQAASYAPLGNSQLLV